MFTTTVEEVDVVAAVVVLAVCLQSAITDVRKFKVYNAVTFPFILIGLVYNIAFAGLDGLKAASLGVICGGGLLFFVFVLGKAGAGDVKLLAGIGAWLGPRLVFEVFLISTIAGAFIALIAMIYTDSIRETGWRFVNLVLQVLVPTGGGRGDGETVQDIVKRGDRRARVIPFAAALFLGTSVVLVHACSLTPPTDGSREPAPAPSPRLSAEAACQVQCSLAKSDKGLPFMKAGGIESGRRRRNL